MARLRSYLLKSTYEWLLDHQLTPFFLINARFKGVQVPTEYVEDGQIILNASAEAVENMYLDDEGISFDASFGSEMMRVFLPLGSIIALYAEETEQGIYSTDNDFTMVINEGNPENYDPSGGEDEDIVVEEEKPRRGHLRVVK